MSEGESEDDEHRSEKKSLKIIPRKKWGALSAVPGGVFPLEHPVKYVWMYYNTESEVCEHWVECKKSIQDLQTMSMRNKSLSDLPYNFLIGGDGRVYEGRGWENRPPKSKSTPEHNGKRLDIGFLGNLKRKKIPKKVKKRALKLISYGIENKYIEESYEKKEWERISKPQDPDESESDSDEEKVKITPREQWGALPPTKTIPLKHPIENIWFVYNTDSAACKDSKGCKESLQGLQKMWMEKLKLSDLPYNFLIGGNGKIYEGRGWFNQTPASKSHPESNGKRLSIGYLGTQTRRELSADMLRAGLKVVAFGLEQKYVKKSYDSLEWKRVGVLEKKKFQVFTEDEESDPI